MKIVFLLLLTISYIFSSSVVIDDNTFKIDNFKISYYEDKTRRLNIEKVSNIRFNEVVDSQFTLGYTKGNNWFKIDITNKSVNEDFILYINEPFFENASLFYFDNYWKEYDAGLFVPLKNRIINDSNPAFPISIKKGESKTYYIKTYAKLASFGEIIIYKKSSFITHYKLNSLVLYMFYFGGLFIMIVFNIFLFIRLKEMIYLYYVSYTFFYAVFVLIFSGISIYLGLGAWHYELHVVTPLFILFFILFSIHFLETKTYLPKVDKLLNLLVIIYILLAVLNFINVDPWYEVVSSVSTLVFIALIYASIKAWIKGHKKAKFYLLAISVYMVTIILLAFMVNGWIENTDISRYSFLVGSFLEFTFFSLMLANRFHDIKNEKIDMQSKLIDLKNQNEIVLEKKVKQRTDELTRANSELKNAQVELKYLNNNLEEKIEKAVKDIQYKEQLLQHQSRLAQMGEMISMIAHQWRQPLGAISSAILGIQTKLNIGKFDLEKKQDSEELLELIDTKHKNINEYVQFLSDTINDFKDSFKPDTNKEWVNITTPINRALHLIEKSIINKGISINLNFKTEDLIYIYQNEMMQVVLNILKNSKDNFEDKNIKDPKIDIVIAKVEKGYLITISDNGGGIANEIKDKIFDPYFSTKISKNGSGLGLYMSKVMIKEHMGGELTVKDIPNGVAFNILLSNIKLGV